MRGQKARILIALILTFALAGSVYAQSFGRIVIVVKDDEGEPIKDVKVTLTCDAITTFHQEKTTNKKGRATISVTDATHVYNLRLEHGAFPPMDTQIKPQLGTTTNREIVLSKKALQQAQAASQAADQPAGGTVVYTPAERVFNEGVELLRGGDMAGAKTKFLESLEKDSEMGLAHSALAGVYLEEENYESALASVQRFLQLDPQSPRGFRMLYEAHSGLGNQEEADDALGQLKKLDRGGDTAKMIFNEGVQATKVGDYANAKKRFLEALEVEPNLHEATGALAIIYFNEKDFAESAAVAERHLTLLPNDQKMMQIRYDAYRNAGDAEKAKASMDAMIAAGVNVDNLLVQFLNKGLKLFEAGDAENAKAEFERVLGINPDHAKAHFHLGISMVSSGETEGAKKHLNRFLELAPNDPEAQTAKDMLSYL